MDRVLADTLVANLKSAKTPEEHSHAMTLALIAIVDCQCKTSERVKELIQAEEVRRTKVDTVGWIARGVFAVLSGGGFAVLVVILKRLGVA